jgi:hypothetical protein
VSRTPTHAEVIRAAVDAALGGVHTAIPGRVTRYVASLQQADVKPLVSGSYLDEDGNRVAAELPVVPNCPVQFASGGGLAFTHPVTVGDYGLLVFSEASLDKWLARSGDVVDPEVDHRFSLSDGIFVPGVLPFGAPLGSFPTDAAGAGAPGGSYQGVALGATLASYLSSLHTWLTGLAAAASYITPQPSVPGVESGALKVTP